MFCFSCTLHRPDDPKWLELHSPSVLVSIVSILLCILSAPGPGPGLMKRTWIRNCPILLNAFIYTHLRRGCSEYIKHHALASVMPGVPSNELGKCGVFWRMFSVLPDTKSYSARTKSLGMQRKACPFVAFLLTIFQIRGKLNWRHLRRKRERPLFIFWIKTKRESNR